MAKMNNLNDLLHDQLKDLYDAEHQLKRALPKMAKHATDAQLKAGFEQHLTETENQIARLEQVFDAMGLKATRKSCKAMKGLIEEGEEVMQEEAPPEVMDAALIAAAQRVEHYEIAGYGTVRTMAQMLGMKDAAKLLEQSLQEEEATDKKLTMLAEKSINQKANMQDNRK
jgi:ferritin-like metal-binding protein YciE